MDGAKLSAGRGHLFVPTGHADLDRLRKDGVSAWCPWYKSAAAGAAAGLTLVVAIPLIYLVFELFAAGVVALQSGGAAAGTELVESLVFAGAYARYAWLGGIAMAAVGAAYAMLHRWTVLRARYVRVGPWEVGVDTLFSAVVGYAGFSVAASAWQPLQVVHGWLFWAWGPVFAWLIARLQELYVWWMVRPGWRLAVESAIRVLVPRRFRCGAADMEIVVDEEARAVTVTVYAAMDPSEAKRARELIQAIPGTKLVTIETVASQVDPVGRGPGEQIAADTGPSPGTGEQIDVVTPPSPGTDEQTDSIAAPVDSSPDRAAATSGGPSRGTAEQTDVANSVEHSVTPPQGNRLRPNDVRDT